MDMDGKTIDKVLATRVQSEPLQLDGQGAAGD